MLNNRGNVNSIEKTMSQCKSLKEIGEEGRGEEEEEEGQQR